MCFINAMPTSRWVPIFLEKGSIQVVKRKVNVAVLREIFEEEEAITAEENDVLKNESDHSMLDSTGRKVRAESAE